MEKSYVEDIARFLEPVKKNVLRLAINRRFLALTNLFLASILILSVMALARDYLLLRGKSALPSPAGTTGRSTPPGATLAGYAAAVTDNPFGIHPALFSPLKGVTRSEEKNSTSATNLKLLGTISGTRGMGYAVIQNMKGVQEIFKVGDDVFDEGTLEAVKVDAVYLKGGTRIGIVDISGKGQSGSGTPAAQGASPSGVKPPGASLPGQGAMPPPQDPSLSSYIKPAGDNSYVVDQAMIQNAVENPRQLMTEARLQPRYADGKQEGFTMLEIKKGGIYDHLGLRNGDILLSINEFKLNDPETGLQAFTALRGAQSIQLNVLRGDQPVTLNYQIK